MEHPVYYQNYCSDSNQILQRDKDLQEHYVYGPKCAPQIQDGGRPPSWKNYKSLYLIWCFHAKICFWSMCWYCLLFRGSNPPNPYSGVNRRFQVKRTKYSNFCIRPIKTTAAIIDSNYTRITLIPSILRTWSQIASHKSKTADGRDLETSLIDWHQRTARRVASHPVVIVLCTKLDAECDPQATVVDRLLTTLGDDRCAVAKYS